MRILKPRFDECVAPLVVFLSCFLLAFVAGSFIIRSADSRAVTGLNLVGATTMVLSTNNNTISLVPVPNVNNGMASGLHTLVASTNVPTGYNLVLSTPNAPTLTATTGTLASPTVLANNSWGYALASASAVGVANDFDASYATPIPSVNSRWANPTLGTVIKNTSTAATNDTVDVYYGAKVDMSLASGTYTNTVAYTATANISTITTPSIVSITPTSGTTAGGTAVEIRGTGFTVNDQSVTTAVMIGGVACQNVAISSNTPNVGQDTIYCDTPAHVAGAVDVVVTTWNNTATAVNGYTYMLPIPVVTAISPDSGHFRGGETFTITGSNFTGATAVSFGGSACRSFVVVSDTSITCVSSGVATNLQSGANSTMTAATNTVSVNVTTPNGTNVANSLFTYRYLNKSNTTAGSFMDIRGTDITLGSSVYVNGIKCTNLKITGSDTAACDAPTTTAGARSVTVQAAAASQGNMQNWSGCSAIATPAYTTTDWSTYTRVLTDTRNNQTYRVRKMPDGRCWMIDNLKLANFTLTNTNSNVSSNFTIPANPVQNAATRLTNGVCVGGSLTGTGAYLTCDGTDVQSAANNAYIAYSDPAASENSSYYNCTNQYMIASDSLTNCGYLYNWYTATAGTGIYSLASGNATASICPAGWTLPTGGSSGQFAVLNNAMAIGSTTASTTNSPATRWNWRYNGAFEGSLAGNFDSGFYASGVLGYFWSSSAYSSTYGYLLYLYYSNVNPGNYANLKYYGFAVRCVL